MNMDRKKIIENISTALSTVSGKEIISLDENMFLKNDFNLESIDVVDFIYELEKVSDLEIDIEQLFETKGNRESERSNDLQIVAIIDYIEKI
jgi:acyl carrier protein